MPLAQMPEDQFLDETEKLFVEQARAYYRDLRAAAQNAPPGKLLAHADAFAFQNGRELIRKSLENLVQEPPGIDFGSGRNPAKFLLLLVSQRFVNRFKIIVLILAHRWCLSVL